MSSPVLCEIADGIATLTLNRPEMPGSSPRMNAIESMLGGVQRT